MDLDLWLLEKFVVAVVFGFMGLIFYYLITDDDSKVIHDAAKD